MSLKTVVHIGIFQKITIQGDGRKILNVQYSLGKLVDCPNAPRESPEKDRFGLELSSSFRL